MSVPCHKKNSIDIRNDFRNLLLGCYSGIKNQSTVFQVFAVLVFVLLSIISVASTSSALSPVLSVYFKTSHVTLGSRKNECQLIMQSRDLFLLE